MKNIKLIALLLAVCLICLSVAACEEKQKPPKIIGKYEVWIGSAALAYRYTIDSYSYTEDGDMIIFVSKNTGKIIISPKCSILQIKAN